MSPAEDAELAAELRRIKDRAGLTLSQLATRTWYSRSSLDRYMNGKVFPPRRVVEAISDSCGADTDEIIAVWERAWSRRRDRTRGADAGTAPMELPADLPDFTGRRAYRAAIEAQLLEDGSAAPAVAVISGMAGAGKTALAVHVAHRLRADFPDGQLYLHLAGMSAHPMRPREALGQLLRSLGVEGSGMPDGVDERAALYRSRLASRRMLILADDAASADQVRPLIPGTATSALVVTSRTRLARLATLEAMPYASWMIAPLAGCGAGEAELLVDQLIAANLLAHNGSDGAGHRRLTMHDLVRDYAREQAERDPPEEHTAATGRLVGAWLDLIERAELALDQRYFPVPRPEAPRWRPAGAAPPRFDHPSWYATNRRALISAIRLACAAGLVRTALTMTALLSSFCYAHSDWTAWRITHEAVLAADPADPYTLRGLGELELCVDRFGPALEYLAEARTRLLAHGDKESAAYVTILLGVTKRRTHNLRSAAGYLGQAQRMFDELGDDRGRSHLHYEWGIQRMYQYDWDAAVDHFGQAIEGLVAARDRRALAQAGVSEPPPPHQPPGAADGRGRMHPHPQRVWPAQGTRAPPRRPH